MNTNTLPDALTQDDLDSIVIMIDDLGYSKTFSILGDEKTAAWGAWCHVWDAWAVSGELLSSIDRTTYNDWLQCKEAYCFARICYMLDMSETSELKL